MGNHGIRPDIALFLVLYASVTVPPVQCACIVFIIGFFLEALSGAPGGLFISTYLLVFASIKLLCRVFNFNTLIELFGLLLACLTVKHLLVCFFMFFIYEYHYELLVQTALNETFFTIILFPFVFPLIRKCIPLPYAMDGATADRHQHAA